MADGILLKHGNSIDETELTTTPQMVRLNKTFIGTTGEEQSGTVSDVVSQSRTLPIGGSLPIATGIHDGSGTVSQNVPTFGGVTIYPTLEQQSVTVGGKYMVEDVVTAPITNLSPEYIKKGVTILGVTGIYEGYN